jgi:hypothetical protein
VEKDSTSKSSAELEEGTHDERKNDSKKKRNQEPEITK